MNLLVSAPSDGRPPRRPWQARRSRPGAATSGSRARRSRSAPYRRGSPHAPDDAGGGADADSGRQFGIPKMMRTVPIRVVLCGYVHRSQTNMTPGITGHRYDLAS